ncbi:flavodoxin and radical SAM domain protein [Morchella snyderi]|nr:flavodoxin and radical SAM domain protein [Morchella snyderi]
MSFNSNEEFRLPDELVELWHTLRLPFIISVVAGLAVYKIHTSIKKLQKEETASLQTLKPAEKWRGTPTPASDERLIDSKVLVGEEVAELGGKDESQNSAGHLAKSGPKRVTGNKKKMSPTRRGKNSRNPEVVKEKEEGDFDIQVLIFYSSLTGSTRTYAEKLQKTLFSTNGEGVYSSLAIPTPSNSLGSVPLQRSFLPAELLDLEEIELDDYFVSVQKSNSDKKIKYVYLLVVPSYETDSPVAPFLEHLQETHHDFRIDTAPLRSLAGFSVFGFGDSSEWPAEEGKFCKDAIEVDKWMGKLTGGRKGSRRMFPVGMGDVNPASAKGKESGNAEESLNTWKIHLEDTMREYAATGELGDVTDWRTAVESGDEDSEAEQEPDSPNSGDEMVDLEDLGGVVKKNPDVSKKGDVVKSFRQGPLPVDFTTPAGKIALERGEGQNPERKEMVPKGGVTYEALTKQGYTIVGSHSGVKICRWTKSALRGRGSCYKFSFYGIKSHLCMETTPSLSCSNKCVFCWRHGTNPVGTTWRWKIDPADEVFKGVVEGHYRKIKMMKGVPGVRADRFSEAFQIRHCALSLVGEPVFYPYINEFLHLLHSSKISSFLVCNAQHPAQLAALGPVTQLYVSIDASNRDSLKKIDRPLHRDFWERFQSCLDILREKRNQQRTVFRLTLVKGFNVDDEVMGYADLVEKGLPCFVEVKGVTYCGTSTAGEAGLTMKNVPFYEEVVAFVEALNKELQRRGLEYGIAAEHAHSCCILIGSNRFFINGRWHTHIDYKRFFELLEGGREFGPEDYIGEATPEWANWGNGGFDPADVRVHRKGKAAKKLRDEAAAEMEAESGGCG